MNDHTYPSVRGDRRARGDQRTQDVPERADRRGLDLRDRRSAVRIQRVHTQRVGSLLIAATSFE